MQESLLDDRQEIKKEPECGIYAIKNKMNGKIYIGQSVNLIKRKNAHFAALEARRHYNTYMQHSANIHGCHSFEFLIVERVPRDLLNEREVYWIGHYKSNNPEFGYNLEGGGNVGKSFSAETCRRISIAQTGRIQPESTRQKIRLKALGRVISVETRLKLSRINKARIRHPLSDETRRKISESLIGIKLGPQSAESRRKKSIALTGKAKSSEHRAKLSASARRWYMNKINTAQPYIPALAPEKAVEQELSL